MFTVVCSDQKTKARVGIIKTPHGKIKTPAFIPDATYGVVKHLAWWELEQIPLQIILGNIYHLSLRPGIKLIKKMGGLHQFINWQKPIITDSGGFQAFSLVYRHRMGKVLQKGIKFKDHLTGQTHFLTPQESIRRQLDVGADILMVLDFPVSPDAPPVDNQTSVDLTIQWAQISKNFFQKQKDSKGKILMAIIQGANSKKMRRFCFQALEKIGFPGYGFGGPPLNQEIVDFTASLIPPEKIRYLMGGGTPADILKAVAAGWDLFDCVIPTRNARHGLVYTFEGKINLKNSRWRTDLSPLEKNCPCSVCRGTDSLPRPYPRAYLHHLFRINDPLGPRLATLHNLTFYTLLMKKIREKIKKGEFSSWAETLLRRWEK